MNFKNLKKEDRIILSVLLFFAVVAILFVTTRDSASIFFHKTVKNEKALSVSEYLMERNVILPVSLTEGTKDQVRKFVEESDSEPTLNPGDILISVGGSKPPDGRLFIRFTDSL